MIRSFAAIVLWVLAVAPAAAAPAEDEAIKATALDYIEGWYLGDAERVAQALHPQLKPGHRVKCSPIFSILSRTASKFRS